MTVLYVCVCVCVCLCTSEGVRYPVSPDAEGQRECESWGESARAGGRGGRVALGVRARECEGESQVFDELVAHWFSACGLQMVRPQPASLLLISAGPVFFEWCFSAIGLSVSMCVGIRKCVWVCLQICPYLIRPA